MQFLLVVVLSIWLLVCFADGFASDANVLVKRTNTKEPWQRRRPRDTVFFFPMISPEQAESNSVPSPTSSLPNDDDDECEREEQEGVIGEVLVGPIEEETQVSTSTGLAVVCVSVLLTTQVAMPTNTKFLLALLLHWILWAYSTMAVGLTWDLICIWDVLKSQMVS